MEAVKESFFTNLLLLEFDPLAMGLKHRIAFNKDMFMLPNKKALDEVLYFLFNKLDPVRCYSDFRDCWPILDKKQEQHFRRQVTNWLNQITKVDPQANLPRLVTIFLSPNGDKLYNYLLSFSRYVLQCSLSSKFNKMICKNFLAFPPQVASQSTQLISENIERMLTAAANVEAKKHESSVKDLERAQNMWQEYSNETVLRYREDVKSIRELEQRIWQIKKSISNIPKQYLDISAERISKVSKEVDKLTSVASHVLSNRDIVSSFVDGRVGEHRLDANDLKVSISKEFMKRCKQHQSLTNKLMPHMKASTTELRESATKDINNNSKLYKLPCGFKLFPTACHLFKDATVNVSSAAAVCSQQSFIPNLFQWGSMSSEYNEAVTQDEAKLFLKKIKEDVRRKAKTAEKNAEVRVDKRKLNRDSNVDEGKDSLSNTSVSINNPQQLTTMNDKPMTSTTRMSLKLQKYINTRQQQHKTSQQNEIEQQQQTQQSYNLASKHATNAATTDAADARDDVLADKRAKKNHLSGKKNEKKNVRKMNRTSMN
ncbi:hypothetical protein HELRODRAFT_179619 [Helobdella robusta]|uniref:HAUS augmin-like complex subunit 6 N-terminal domain-containing protein n=1 Tax=Helobdella robusta TaxID=6412 RepID=T1FEY1_HELRO|nr:hypothetical protein HELRODRAFT_179619 [Helobdella robusta]ESN95276.1 hypothetical protein HELRODRAFT_179619 [Helobdella robusta]